MQSVWMSWNVVRTVSLCCKGWIHTYRLFSRLLRWTAGMAVLPAGGVAFLLLLNAWTSSKCLYRLLSRVAFLNQWHITIGWAGCWGLRIRTLVNDWYTVFTWMWHENFYKVLLKGGSHIKISHKNKCVLCSCFHENWGGGSSCNGVNTITIYILYIQFVFMVVGLHLFDKMTGGKQKFENYETMWLTLWQVAVCVSTLSLQPLLVEHLNSISMKLIIFLKYFLHNLMCCQ
jgi:hypothetical protein